jgi:hypothetical protein
MNNWFRLTSEQITEINKKYPNFDEDELKFNGKHWMNREFIGGEYVYDYGIEWLEVNIGNKWITLIDDCKKLSRVPFFLTNEQYDSILNELTNRLYD